MASSPSPFSNNSKVTPTTFVLTQSINNNFTINNIGGNNQHLRQATTSNGTILQPITGGIISTPTSIVRLNQPLSNSSSNQFVPQTVWTTNATPGSPRLQYSPIVKNETVTSNITQQPTKLVAQPVVSRSMPSAPAPKFTETQINDFVAKCRTFLLTLLKLAEKQAPEKLPMVRSCIQDLLNGTIDPESFTQRLHTLYKSQPHTSLVPFFKLALPHMRLIVKNIYGQSITIELLEKLNLPSSSTAGTTMRTSTPTTSSVVVNPSLLSQNSSSGVQQPLLYTTVQPQQKINILQQTPNTPTLISSTTSLLGQQQQQQQQARAQINIAGIRPLIATVSPSSNTNLLSAQQHIQPVTQTIIPQSDSSGQRTFLASTTFQQPQIITINHQTIKTEIVSHQPTNISSLQQQIQNQAQLKSIAKVDDDSVDDHHGLLTAATVDDRHARHITHDNRLLAAPLLRRRLDHLVKNDQRWESGSITAHDDAVLAVISHATEERLKCIIDQIRTAAQKRMTLAGKNPLTSKLGHERLEDEPARPTDQDDNEASQIADNHTSATAMETSSSQGNAEETKRKRQFEESTNHHRSSSSIVKSKHKKRRDASSRRVCRGNLHDVLSIMERDKHLRRSVLFLKALNQAS